MTAIAACSSAWSDACAAWIRCSRRWHEPRTAPPDPTTQPRLAVWINLEFLVQVFDEGSGMRRLSVNRTLVKPGGGWREDITWEDLQAIKRQSGMGDRYAVEVYPRDVDVVNVANMRHLWVLPAPLGIGWFRRREEAA